MSTAARSSGTRRQREPVFRTLEIIAHSLSWAQGLDLHISGVENVPRRGGGVLLINHTGYVDFLPAAIGVYRAGRRVRFMIKSEVMDVAIMRFLVTRTKTVPVDRSRGEDAYRAAVDSLKRGKSWPCIPRPPSAAASSSRSSRPVLRAWRRSRASR